MAGVIGLNLLLNIGSFNDAWTSAEKLSAESLKKINKAVRDAAREQARLFNEMGKNIGTEEQYKRAIELQEIIAKNSSKTITAIKDFQESTLTESGKKVAKIHREMMNNISKGFDFSEAKQIADGKLKALYDSLRKEQDALKKAEEEKAKVRAEAQRRREQATRDAFEKFKRETIKSNIEALEAQKRAALEEIKAEERKLQELNKIRQKEITNRIKHNLELSRISRQKSDFLLWSTDPKTSAFRQYFKKAKETNQNIISEQELARHTSAYRNMVLEETKAEEKRLQELSKIRRQEIKDRIEHNIRLSKIARESSNFLMSAGASFSGTMKQYAQKAKLTNQDILSTQELTKYTSQYNKKILEASKAEQDRLQQLDVALGKAKRGADALNNTKLSPLASTINEAKTAMLGLVSAQALFNTLEVGMKLESAQASFRAMTGSAEKAAKAFEFVRKVSHETGVSLVDGANSFRLLYGSAKGTGTTMEEIQRIYKTTANASAILGLSLEDTNGIFRAFGQILSKGTTQAEELKSQLGDRLPGSLGIAAKAMGVTNGELLKMMENGELLTREFLPKFITELGKIYNDKALATVQGTLLYNFKQLKLAVQEFQEKAVLNKDVSEAITGVTTALTDLIGAFAKFDSGKFLDFFDMGMDADDIKEATKEIVQLGIALIGLNIAKSLKPIFTDLIGRFNVVSQSANLATLGMTRLDSALSGLGRTAGIARGAVGALIVGLNALRSALTTVGWVAFAYAVTEVIDKIGEADETLADFEKRVRETNLDLNTTQLRKKLKELRDDIAGTGGGFASLKRIFERLTSSAATLQENSDKRFIAYNETKKQYDITQNKEIAEGRKETARLARQLREFASKGKGGASKEEFETELYQYKKEADALIVNLKEKAQKDKERAGEYRSEIKKLEAAYRELANLQRTAEDIYKKAQAEGDKKLKQRKGKTADAERVRDERIKIALEKEKRKLQREINNAKDDEVKKAQAQLAFEIKKLEILERYKADIFDIAQQKTGIEKAVGDLEKEKRALEFSTKMAGVETEQQIKLNNAKEDEVEKAKIALETEQKKLEIMQESGKAEPEILKQIDNYLKAYNKLEEAQDRALEKADKERVEKTKEKFDTESKSLPSDSVEAMEQKIRDFASFYSDTMDSLADKNGENAQQLTETAIEAIEKLQNEIEKINNVEVKVHISGFDEISNGIAGAVNGFIKLQDAINETEEKTSKLTKGSEAYNLVALDGSSKQIGAYADMTSAMSSFFQKNEQANKHLIEAQKVMLAAQMAIELQKQLAYGTTAMAASLTLPPPASFVSYAATGALLASLGIMVGGAISGRDKLSTTYDAFSAIKANSGTGTVLGDVKAGSDSIVNSLDILSDLAKPEYELIANMNKSLMSIDSKIGGVTTMLFRGNGYALGDGYNGAFDTGFSNKLKLNSNIAGAGGILGGTIGVNSIYGLLPSAMYALPVAAGAFALDKILLGGALSKGINEVLGGIFGKKSVSRSLADSGLLFDKQGLLQAINDFEGSAYQTIATTTTKKSWFKKSTSTSYSTDTEALSEEVEMQFQLILKGMYDGILQAGKMLEVPQAEIVKRLDDFVVDLGKISLKGKTGKEIQELLSNVFGKTMDEMVRDAYGDTLDGFQKVGETISSTLTRVSAGMEEAEYYISKLGYKFEDIDYKAIINKQGEVGVEALRQSLLKHEQIYYKSATGIDEIVNILDGTTEEVYNTFLELDKLRAQMSALGQDINGITLSMVKGAGGVSSLSDAMDSYFENFLTDAEQSSYLTKSIAGEFAKLNLELPNGIEGFKQLIESIDLTAQSGQELYGRVMLLSEAFGDASKKAKELLDTQMSAELEMDELKRKLIDEEKNLLEDVIEDTKKLSDVFGDLGKSIDDTITNLLGNAQDSKKQYQVIQSFWDKKSEIDALLKKGGDLTQADSDRLQKLISNINSVSRDIQSGSGDKNITSNLVSELSELKNALDFDNQILQTQIVDAEGRAIGVAEEKGVISQLVEQLKSYNDKIESRLKIDKELTFEDFKAGGTLSTADEIAFRQSFQAEDYSSFDKELNDLRRSLSYLSLPTTDATKFLSDLSRIDVIAYENIKEAMGSIGDNRFLDIFKSIKLPSFDVGTAEVPYDMVAQIHKGETIIPSTFAESIRNGQLSISGNGYNSNMKNIEQSLVLINDKLGRVISIQNNQLSTQRATLSAMES